MKKRIQDAGLDESSILIDARKILAPQIEDRSRRSFLLRGLTLGGVAMLSGCNLTDNDSVETALSSMSRFCGLGLVCWFHGWRRSTGLPSGSFLTNISWSVQSS